MFDPAKVSGKDGVEVCGDARSRVSDNANSVMLLSPIGQDDGDGAQWRHDQPETLYPGCEHRLSALEQLRQTRFGRENFDRQRRWVLTAGRLGAKVQRLTGIETQIGSAIPTGKTQVQPTENPEFAVLAELDGQVGLHGGMNRVAHVVTFF